jgi:hypothetical protein
MGGTCSKYGTGVNFIQTSTGKRERKIYLEYLGIDLKKMDFIQMGWESVDWIYVAQYKDQ